MKASPVPLIPSISNIFANLWLTFLGQRLFIQTGIPLPLTTTFPPHIGQTVGISKASDFGSTTLIIFGIIIPLFST